MPLLNPGDSFPTLTLTQPGGQTLTLPGLFAGNFGVSLLYHGSWCQYRQAQLEGFQRAGERLAEVDAQVVALSTDGEAPTAALITDLGLTFPVGHSADAAAISAATGAFTNAGPIYFQSAGFVTDPSGCVALSIYSSGAIGRLVPNDVIGLVRYVRQPLEDQ